MKDCYNEKSMQFKRLIRKLRLLKEVNKNGQSADKKPNSSK